MNQWVVSSHFPYLPVHLQVRQSVHDAEAFLDTGFDGDIAVPRALLGDIGGPDGMFDGVLADGSAVAFPSYRGELRLGNLARLPVVVAALGDEVLLGRGVTDRFTVILDHGQQVIIEP